MKLRDAVLGQFEPEVASALIEFGKSLSTIDTDVCVFMARKSLRLYDTLLKLGIPPIERTVVSDHILDMRLEPIRQKNIALIDDSIILGSTLGETKRRLELEANANVHVHAFCLDIDCWQKELVEPNTVFLKLTDRQIMSFCTAEVRALSIVPMPYLVDFPFSLPIRIRIGDSQCLLSAVEWNVHRISTDIQERHDVTVLSFFPNKDMVAQTFSALGNRITDLIELVKVRVFARTHENVHWLQIVPIVTLKPITISNLSDLLSLIIERISVESNSDLTRLVEYTESPESKNRLVQFILSAALGSNFMSTIERSVGASIEKGFDLNESERHFGPWFSNELSNILSYASIALAKNNVMSDKVNGLYSTPSTLKQLGLTISERSEIQDDPDPTNYANLIADFAEIFLTMYDEYEKPARDEARNLKERILSVLPSQAPYRDRLKKGITWSFIVDRVLAKYGIEHFNEKLQEVLSLVLDLCNDVGITVPITRFEDGIVYRAYRHGEDVRFSDGELVLAYEAVKGLLRSSHRTSVPHLVLEKLLVLLIKIGAAKRFLEPFWGPSGTQGTVRIGFYLKGAVPILARGTKNDPDRDIWLSQYLLRRGVIKVDETNGLYTLGKEVEGNFYVPNAPDDAYELGFILGEILKSAESPSQKDAPLAVEDLIILATCWNPRHAAAALQVELDIFRGWYEDEGVARFTSINWKEPDSLSTAIDGLVRSKGHEAVHSAKMKYIGYKSGNNDRKVQKCEEYLKNLNGNDLLSRKWKSYWTAVTASRNIGEKERFDPWIDKGMKVIWEIASCLSTIEIVLSTSLFNLKSDSNYVPEKALKKFLTYSIDLQRLGLKPDGAAHSLTRRFQEIGGESLLTFNKEEAFKYSTGYLSKILPTVAGLVETIGPIIEEYGKLYGRHDYKYVLWYDIRDSSGNESGLAGKDLEKYREGVRLYKKWTNEQFHRLSIIARKDNGDIYCFRGSNSSTDDEKNVFVSGKFARRYMFDVLNMLLQGTQAYTDVRLRIIMLPCNFAGTSAFRREFEPEIYGERFWEHLSRLKKKALSLEEKCDIKKTFFLVGTNELLKNFSLPTHVKWINTKEARVSSEIELLTRETLVKYGNLNIIV